MFVDFLPLSGSSTQRKWSDKSSHIGQVEEMERCIKDDIKDVRFIPYIQLHEFEALLFASNEGFNSFFDEIQKEKAQQIINSYDNPEDINTTPEGCTFQTDISYQRRL